MTLRPHRVVVALTSVFLVHVGGCSAAKDDTGGAAAAPINCDGAVQSIPASCTNRTCTGVVIPPDKEACQQCATTSHNLGLDTNPLTPCSCNKCAAQLAACFTSADAARNSKCQAIVQCALNTGCAGADCYCGVGKALADCLAETTPAVGPCHAEIEAASGCAPTDRGCVATHQYAADDPVALAYAVGLCSTGDPTMPMVMPAGLCKM